MSDKTLEQALRDLGWKIKKFTVYQSCESADPTDFDPNPDFGNGKLVAFFCEKESLTACLLYIPGQMPGMTDYVIAGPAARLLMNDFRRIF